MMENNFDGESASTITKPERHLLIKTNSSSILKGKIVSAKQKAKEVLQDSQNTAQEIIKQAQIEAEKIKQIAKQSSHEKATQDLLNLILEIQTERENLIHTLEKDILELSLKIAQKIIGEEIKSFQEIKAQIIYHAIRQVEDEIIKVKINVNDLPLIENLTQPKSQNKIEFLVDSLIKEGGCVIECRTGTKDFRLETQFKVMEKTLLEKFSSGK